jgi:hypothetical protein
VKSFVKHLAFHSCTLELFSKLERALLKGSSVKEHSDTQGKVRRRKSSNAVNSKLIMAAVRLWELKRRNPNAAR